MIGDELTLLDSYTKSLDNVLKIDKKLQTLRKNSLLKINSLNDRSTLKEKDLKNFHSMQLKLSTKTNCNRDDFCIITSVQKPLTDNIEFGTQYPRLFGQTKQCDFESLTEPIIIQKTSTDNIENPNLKTDERFYNKNLCSNPDFLSNEKLIYKETSIPRSHNYSYSKKKLKLIEAINRNEFDGLKIKSKIAPNINTCDPQSLVQQLNGVCLNLIDQHSRDEELLSKYINMILNIKEKAVINSTKHELLRLKIKGSNAYEQLSSLKKKQRGILIKLQQEYNEIRLMKSFQKKLFDARKKALLRQLRFFKTILGVNSSSINLKNTSICSNETDKNLPLKCYDITLNDKNPDTSYNDRSLLCNHKKTLNDLLLLHFDLQMNTTALNLINRKHSNSEIISVLKNLSQKSILDQHRHYPINEKPSSQSDENLDCSMKLITSEVMNERIIDITDDDSIPKPLIHENFDGNIEKSQFSEQYLNIPSIDVSNNDDNLLSSIFGKTCSFITKVIKAKQIKTTKKLSPLTEIDKLYRQNTSSLCKSLFFHSTINRRESIFSNGIMALFNKFHIMLEFTFDTKHYVICCRIQNQSSLSDVVNIPSDTIARFIENVKRICFGDNSSIKLKYNNVTIKTDDYLKNIRFKYMISENDSSLSSNLIFLTDVNDHCSTIALNSMTSLDDCREIFDSNHMKCDRSKETHLEVEDTKFQKLVPNKQPVKDFSDVLQTSKNKIDLFANKELDQHIHDKILPFVSFPPTVSKSINQLEEAEELRKKQLAVEMEIKALLEQQTSQLPYFIVREIPDKPPPPYIPPEDKINGESSGDHLSGNKTISKVVKMCYENIWESFISQPYSNLCDTSETLKNCCDAFKESHSLNSNKQFLFDLCNELFCHKYKNANKLSFPWEYQKRFQQSRNDVCSSVETSAMQCLGFGSRPFKDNIFINCAHKLQDHVDELLIRELQDEEAEWINIEEYEMNIKNSVAESILNDLIMNTIQEYVVPNLKNGF